VKFTLVTEGSAHEADSRG